MPRLTVISEKDLTVTSKRSPVVVKTYSGSDFSAGTSVWTFGLGNISLVSTTLPYHSYGNSTDPNTPTSQNCNKTWPYRGGTNVGNSNVATSSSSNIGYWINGVNMYNPSAGSTAPLGHSTFAHLNYNASYAESKALGYSFGQDNAGGYAVSGGAYNYRDFSFGNAWITGNGHVSGSTGVYGSVDVIQIPYMVASLVNRDGHSKILGFSLDGYPVYGPYGYSHSLDPYSGVRAMISGYAMYTSATQVAGRVTDGASNTTTYPLGMFVQDFYYAGGGDLDICNGRYCITPEYPRGTYAYFVTVNPTTLTPVYPYVLGNYYYSMPAANGQTTSTPGSGNGSLPVQTN